VLFDRNWQQSATDKGRQRLIRTWAFWRSENRGGEKPVCSLNSSRIIVPFLGD
jgi:hypothetical protein